MIRQMTKYDFVIFHKDVEGFLNGIQSLGVMDITRKSKPVDEKSKEMFDKIARCKSAVKQLRKIKEQMAGEGAALLHDSEAEKYSPENAGRILAEAEALLEQKKNLATQLAAVKARIAEAAIWGDFRPEDVERIVKLGFTPHFYAVPAKSFDDSLAEKYPLQILNGNGSKVCFVILTAKGEMPALKYAESKLPELPVSAEEEKAAGLRAEIEKNARDLYLLSAKCDILNRYVSSLEADADLYLASGSSLKRADDMLEVFTGFAPVENDEAVRNYLFVNSDGVYYISNAAEAEDNPPIALKGNRFTKMFAMLTDMYGRPKYDEFDPTPYISIFFTLFFAMCMGDAGYGLLLIIIGLFARKMAAAKSFAPLILVLGAATLVIGTVLHTFFGIDLSTAGWVPAVMKKFMITGQIGGYDAQMVLAIMTGVAHICVAMVVKAVYAVRRGGFANSLGTIGWTLLIVGGVIVGAIALTGVISKTATKIVIIALGELSALGIYFLNDLHRNPMKNFGSGLWETYNTATGLIGDILSYIRLYALGLAGGMLGAVFNQLGTGILEGLSVPGLNWFFFILIVVFGHVLNLAMCCLGAFVHPLRLNFLEFFKNSGYEGSGKAYKPLTTNK